MIAATQSLAEEVGVQAACSALCVPRATYYRHTRPKPRRPDRRTPPLKLAEEESKEVLDVLHSERFVDLSPRQVWAALLDEDERYLCSVRTMYRLLAGLGETRERRNQLAHPSYSKPELLATGPNEVWSWDITKVRGPSKGIWYYLYVILDVFSRYVVGWMLACQERADLAEELIRSSLEKQGIGRDELTLHADRGTSMTAKSVALLLSNLGVGQSHSRPYTSNDNPYSESQFKTMKYHFSYPDRFGSPEDARSYFSGFMQWYNHEHRHSNLALLPPAEVHYGRAAELLSHREAALRAAFAKHPSRFKGRVPKAGTLPKEVWINPPPPEEEPFLPSPETPGPEQLPVAVSDHGQRELPAAAAGEKAAQLFDELGRTDTLEVAH